VFQNPELFRTQVGLCQKQSTLDYHIERHERYWATILYYTLCHSFWVIRKVVFRRIPTIVHENLCILKKLSPILFDS
jgi:hypothetical protein